MSLRSSKGATLPQPDWPVIETARLILRQWRASDVTANTMMLGDPLSARFITADRKPVTEPMMAAGATPRHGGALGAAWLRHVRGRGEVKPARSSDASGRCIRRAGRGLRSAGVSQRNSVARVMPSKRHGPSIDWSFATFEIGRDHPLHRSRETASQAVARRLGAHPRDGETIVRLSQCALGDTRVLERLTRKLNRRRSHEMMRG